MNLKYDEFLFSEIITKMTSCDSKELKNELYDRMNFCGFNADMINCFIDLEKLIVKVRKLKFKSPLYNKYWWFNNNSYNLNSIFSNTYNHNEIFMLNTQVVTKNTLTFSELLSLLNEATYVDVIYKNKNKSVEKEISLFSELHNNKWVRKEITYRFMACYDKIFGKQKEMPTEYFNCVNKLIDNELQILNLCKWVYPLDKQNGINSNWKPYTSEFYSFFYNID